jgi:Protein of unknown function (DUF1394).
MVKGRTLHDDETVLKIFCIGVRQVFPVNPDTINEIEFSFTCNNWAFVFLQNSDIPIENTTETLSTMAKVCLRMLESP